MAEVIETRVYMIDELDDAAKERARHWWRECLDDDWHEPVIDDFCQFCKILGVELKTIARPLVGGGTRAKPCVWFTGFASQGDGACFEGWYGYAAQSAKRIRDHAPTDDDFHAIASRLQQVQRRNFYQLQATISHRGRYCHAHSMEISVSRDSGTGQEISDGAEDEIADALRDLANWLYRALEREFEYQTSDDVVDEMIAVNGYTFTADGRRFG